MKERVYTALFPFGGIGGFAIGALRARARLFGVEARIRVIGGIDMDKGASADFESLVGAPSLVANIKYLKRHELLQLCPESPDMVVWSPPCKGASALLSAAKAKTEKYEDMNRLALDWVELMLETWDEPPRLLLLENVPRLKQRAPAMLKQLRALLRRAGYVMHDSFHDCGELGGLAQVRKRYLLAARDSKRCPPLLYLPPKRRVRGCGEVLGQLPLPGDPAAGPMHRLPRLSWLNWVRLALIPAGGDWRDLEGVLRDGQPRREVHRRHMTLDWARPSPTVAGSGSNGPNAVADPREPFGNTDRVAGWGQPVGTVTSSPAPSSGGGAVADPRVLIPSAAYDNGYGVLDWREPSPTVAGGSDVGQGAYAIADGRVDKNFGGGAFGVTPWEEPSGAVAGESYPSNGRFATADPRVEQARRDAWGVLHWDEPSGCVTGNGRVAAGPFSVADLRVEGAHHGTYGVMSWREAASTITGNARPSSGRFTIADPRKPPPFTPFIVSADGTWHRPITTLECGALQSFLEYIPVEKFVLCGKAQGAWRERIGNAVPPAAAEAITERALYTLLAADLGGFALDGNLKVWVEREIAEARA